MTVDSFDPKAMSGAVTDAQVAQWLAVAERCGVGGDAVAIEQVDHGLVASLFLPGWDNTCGELDNTADKPHSLIYIGGNAACQLADWREIAGGAAG